MRKRLLRVGGTFMPTRAKLGQASPQVTEYMGVVLHIKQLDIDTLNV